MGKKYLEIKKNSLESSVLGVWKTAIEEGESRMDGRTKQYKSHRSNLEAARLRREERKINKEEVKPDSGLIKPFYNLDEGKMKELHGYIEDGKSAEWIAKKMGVDVKTIKALMKESIDEGTWLRPKGVHLQGLKKLLTKPLELGKNGDNATDAISNFIGDDELFDDLYDAGKKDPKGDARPHIKDAMKRLGIKEEVELDEASGDKEAYKKFFDAALKKFKVSSPAELKGDQKKKFFDYIDKNWEGDNEKAEGALNQVKEFKIQSMKAALAKVWGMEEGHNPFVEHKGTKPHKHPHDEDQDEEHEKRTKTETGKKPAAIDLKPKIDDR